jgi:hypothetical protein
MCYYIYESHNKLKCTKVFLNVDYTDLEFNTTCDFEMSRASEI